MARQELQGHTLGNSSGFHMGVHIGRLPKLMGAIRNH